jgi:PAS domain S-box-containing protein
MDPFPRHLLPVGCESSALRSIAATLNLHVLPSVADTAALEAAINAYPVVVAIIGPDWPESQDASARELILNHAAACVETEDLEPTSLAEKITTALGLRAHKVESCFLDQILALLPDPVFFKDRRGRFLAGNKAIAEHLGVEDPALLIGRSDFDFFSAEHAQQAFEDEQEVIRTEKPILAKLEHETYHADKNTWCLTWKTPLRDTAGRLIGICGFSRDVTDLKMTEAALSTERHLLEALLTGMPDSVFIKDRDGRFLLANHVVATWMGTTPELLRGRRDEDFFPKAMAAEFRKDEESVMATGMPVVNREERVSIAGGRELWVLTTKLPYCNAKGEIVGVIGMGRNISLRKSFDEQLKIAQAEVVTLRAEVARLKGETPSNEDRPSLPKSE